MSAIEKLLAPEMRVLSAAERPAVLRAIEEWSGFSGPDVLVSAYPHVFAVDAESLLLGAFHEGRIAAHAAVREVVVVTSAGDQKATLIGSVITAPSLRGKGIGSELVRHVAARAAEAGRDAVYLWSERWSFYERLGFEASGTQHEARIRTRPGSLAPGIRPAHASDLPGILALHRNKPLRIERALHDLALMLSTSGLLTMVLERAGKTAAYACFGKGIDFVGWWHEYGGSDEDVATLVLGTMEVLGQREATLLVPPYRKGLLERMRHYVADTRAGSGALRKVLTPLGNAEFFIDGLDSI